MNRFTEMINAGIAPAKYDNRFSSYNNNANYHTLDEIVKSYNNVWGALTGTMMRHDVHTDEYIITGQAVTQEWYKRLLYAVNFDTTFFCNSFKGTNIRTLDDFFCFHGLVHDYSVFNGDNVIKCWKGIDDCTNMFNNVFGYTGGQLCCKDDAYYCTGISCDAFESLLDKYHEGLDCFANHPEMKSIKCETLREALKHYNVHPVLMNESIKLIKLDNINNEVKLVKESFKDDSVMTAGGTTLFSNALFTKYRDYLSNNVQSITENVKVLVETTYSTKKIADLLFPFANVSCPYNVALIEGVGAMSVYEGGLSFKNCVNGENFYVKVDEDFINNLTASLKFFKAA